MANKTILQGFEWYSVGLESTLILPKPGYKDEKPRIRATSHWTRLEELLPQFSVLGITSIWIPPACKATNPKDNGYGVYDLYDLGEFNTKGSVATKWGTKAELEALCGKAQSQSIDIIFDAVLNHRASPDALEECLAVRVDLNERTKELDVEPRTINAWTKFNYEARNGKYSGLRYHSVHFSGTDWDHKTREKGIFKIMGKRSDGSAKNWAVDVATTENGNYDYLMFVDVDYGDSEVQEDVKRWGRWLVDTLPGVRGMRLDAIKHYSASFQRKFIDYIAEYADCGNDKFFFIGEYWLANSKYLSSHLSNIFAGTNFHLFDVKLMYNFHDFSTGTLRDLRKVFGNTFVALQPTRAVTFVTNHDTQEMQSLAAPVEPWFIPHAYAIILLRIEGTPCVFWGDLYGTNGPKPREPACGGHLSRLVLARKHYAYGRQEDYFDDPRCIGWVRGGMSPDAELCGLTVLVNTAWSWRRKRMRVAKVFAGQVWSDIMGWAWSGVLIDDEGYGEFVVGPRSVSVWTWQNASFREEIDSLVYPLEPEFESQLDDGIERGFSSTDASHKY
ncbi:hypothetical protein H2198_009373 [Neophaeococcomyces mojaviensis]|uniref:Uncharacterized protein n=1 Tax=Neophaeococcomyces mojaviensis TaxID=3383035 RepID=A0ACC2ZUJ7_9EURO|nr:hypothetical protein H2198_009373 [Knufia sp. JES_112]